MTDFLGFIWPGVRQVLTRPDRWAVALIPGGPAAPELACRPIDFRADRLPARASAEVKLDGICCLFADGRMFTLEGQPFNAARHCLPALQELERAYGEPMFFHAEYVEDGGFDATVKAFRKGEGQGVVWLHDAVPFSEWKTNTGTQPRWSRKAELGRMVPQLRSEFVGVLTDAPVDGEAMVHAMFQRVRALGFEGVVVKDMDAPYRRERDGKWMRVKPCDTLDLPLLEIAGDDARGARRLICRDSAGPVTLSAGWTRDQAHELWRHRDLLTGTDLIKAVEIEVEHTGRTEGGKLRHARFLRLRQDRQPIRNQEY